MQPRLPGDDLLHLVAHLVVQHGQGFPAALSVACRGQSGLRPSGSSFEMALKRSIALLNRRFISSRTSLSFFVRYPSRSCAFRMTFAIAPPFCPTLHGPRGVVNMALPVVRSQPMVRRRFVYRGTIQGVGFRPSVYRAASRLGLAGFVRNLRSEVLVEVQGDEASVEAFPLALADALPAAARVESVQASASPCRRFGGGRFPHPRKRLLAIQLPPVPPDLAVCPDCRRELLDPADRRYLYPFITCTQCGPRYSILAPNPVRQGRRRPCSPSRQCPACRREYEDPLGQEVPLPDQFVPGVRPPVALPRCGRR